MSSSAPLDPHQEHKPSQNASAAWSTPELVKLVHLTDLHYGLGFNANLWTHLKDIMKNIKPDIILITGDLVNSPFRYSLRSIKARLDALISDIQEANGTNPAAKLYVIPGNHDTRLSGLLPTQWIMYFIFFDMLLLTASYMHSGLSSLTIAILVTFISLIVTYMSIGHFDTYFQNNRPSLPQVVPDLGVILYPFDSATCPTAAASGEITQDQFVAGALHHQVNARRGAYKIALLHHHSLPIPHDYNQEPLMILRNAGAFLSQSAALGIRLILCGHKHHNHFSRVTINAQRQDANGIYNPSELCVLNTGSPTAKDLPHNCYNSFNLIEVYRRAGAYITPYIADGATFTKGQSYWAESNENLLVSIFNEDSLQKECYCDTIEVSTHINQDGDAFRLQDIADFKYCGDGSIDKIPGNIVIDVGTGQIEMIRVNPDKNGLIKRDPYFRPQVQNRRHRVFSVHFSSEITRYSDAISYSWQCHTSNSFAMSLEQANMMNIGGPEIEYVTFEPPFPSKEAVVRVFFPQNFQMDGVPWIEIYRGRQRQKRFEELYNSKLLYVSNAHYTMILLSMTLAPAGLEYRINWRLRNVPPPAGHALHTLSGDVRRVADMLKRLHSSGTNDPAISNLVDFFGLQVRRFFGLESSTTVEPLSISIMIFDNLTNKLCIAASTFYDEERHKFTLDYGDGIAGRAYKMNRTTVFIKRDVRTDAGDPFVYTPVDSEAIPAGRRDVDVEVMLCMPLSNPLKPDETFAILNVGTTYPYSKLIDIKSKFGDVGKSIEITEFRLALSQVCLKLALGEEAGGTPLSEVGE